MRTLLRWLARAGLALAAIVVVAGTAVYLLSERALARRFPVVSDLHAAPATPEAIARGRRLAVTRGCTDCHGDNLAGKVLVDDPMVGRLYTANLTTGRGGRGGALATEDWERAIRHGVRRDGSGIVAMPVGDFARMSDEDVASLIAYARSVAPVDAEHPRPHLGPLGRVLAVAGKLPLYAATEIDHAAPHAARVSEGATVAYGKYLAQGCTGCHRATFTGGPIPGLPPELPPARNITGDATLGIGAWSEEQFVTALTTGKRPDGTALRPPMPIETTKAFTDTELRALYRYLRTVPTTVVAAR